MTTVFTCKISAAKNGPRFARSGKCFLAKNYGKFGQCSPHARGVGSGQLAHALSVRIAQVPLAHGAPRAFGARRRRLPCPARGLLRPVNGFEELNRVTRKTSSSCERPITFHFSAFCLDFQAGLGNFEGLRCSCRNWGKEVFTHLFIYTHTV